MVTEEEIAELIKNYFPNCPICGSDSGYNISGFSKNYFQCNSCRAKWMSYDLIQKKVTDIALKKMMLYETPADGRGKSLLRKEHPVDLWKNLSEKRPELISPPQIEDKEEYVEPIFTAKMTDEQLFASILKNMKEVNKWERGSTLSGFTSLFDRSTIAERTTVRLLKVISEQNKIIIKQNELIYRALKKLSSSQREETSN